MYLDQTLELASGPWARYHLFTNDYLAERLKAGNDVMVIDVEDARKNAREIWDEFHAVFGDKIKMRDIRFATKAAPCGEIMQAVHKLYPKAEKEDEQGLGLEVASEAEIKMAQKLGVKGENIVFSNPGKHITTAIAAMEAGVRLFVTDSMDDLQILSEAASKTQTTPDQIQVMIRLQQPKPRGGADDSKVDSCGSHLGMPVEDATQPIDVIRLAKSAQNEMGFKVVGTTFNAGTNQHNISRWEVFINESARFAKLAKANGLNDVNIIDMGGSFPAKTSGSVKPVREYAQKIHDFIQKAYVTDNGLDFPRTIIEPGRSISHKACLFSSVISKKPYLGKAEEKDDAGNVIVPDDFHLVTTAGHYNSGLRVSLDDLDGDKPDDAGFTVRAFRFGENNKLQPLGGENARYSMEGLVTADVAKYAQHVSLPKDLKHDDVVCFENVGAYSRSFITHWLGFKMPEMWIIDSGKNNYKSDINQYKRHISNFNLTQELEWIGAESLARGSMNNYRQAEIEPLTNVILNMIPNIPGVDIDQLTGMAIKAVRDVKGTDPNDGNLGTGFVQLATQKVAAQMFLSNANKVASRMSAAWHDEKLMNRFLS